MRKAGEWMSQDLPSTVRSIAKWYFDLIKNVFVVVALWYTWNKTGNAVVGTVATLTFTVFFLYARSYPLTVYEVIRTYGRSRSPLLGLLITVLAGIVLYGSVVAVALAALKVIAALFSAQGSIK
jgi:hypothetical protein